MIKSLYQSQEENSYHFVSLTYVHQIYFSKVYINTFSNVNDKRNSRIELE